jgi:hypothetical protein
MNEVSRTTTTPDTQNELITLWAAKEILGTTTPYAVRELCKTGELSVYSIPNSPAWMVLSAHVEAYAAAVREGRKSLPEPYRWNGVHEPWCNDHQDFGEDDSWCSGEPTSSGAVGVHLSQTGDDNRTAVVLEVGADVGVTLELDQAKAIGTALLGLHWQATSPKLADGESLNVLIGSGSAGSRA